VSFRTSKHSRITLIEAPTGILPTIDLCKVADLAVFLIDINVGFEMELFEAVTVLKTHGFPQVMGIMTHLDMIKDNKSLKKMRKRMKDRFWKEV
jgi:ribosome biogenesis protein BMS1